MKVEIERDTNRGGGQDSIYLHVDGGLSAGGLTIRVDVPHGHAADDITVEQSAGLGWHALRKSRSEMDAHE